MSKQEIYKRLILKVVECAEKDQATSIYVTKHSAVGQALHEIKRRAHDCMYFGNEAFTRDLAQAFVREDLPQDERAVGYGMYQRLLNYFHQYHSIVVQKQREWQARRLATMSAPQGCQQQDTMQQGPEPMQFQREPKAHASAMHAPSPAPPDHPHQAKQQEQGMGHMPPPPPLQNQLSMDQSTAGQAQPTPKVKRVIVTRKGDNSDAARRQQSQHPSHGSPQDLCCSTGSKKRTCSPMPDVADAEVAGMVASAKKQRSHGSESQDQVQDTVAGSPVSASASGATQAAAACAPNDAAGQKVLHPMTDSTPLASATTTTTANICNNTSTDVAPDGAGLRHWPGKLACAVCRRSKKGRCGTLTSTIRCDHRRLNGLPYVDSQTGEHVGTTSPDMGMDPARIKAAQRAVHHANLQTADQAAGKGAGAQAGSRPAQPCTKNLRSTKPTPQQQAQPAPLLASASASPESLIKLERSVSAASHAGLQPHAGPSPVSRGVCTPSPFSSHHASPSPEGHPGAPTPAAPPPPAAAGRARDRSARQGGTPAAVVMSKGLAGQGAVCPEAQGEALEAELRKLEETMKTQMRLVKLQRRRLARQRVAKEAEIEKVKNQLREMGRSLETGPAHSTPASAPTCVGARGAAGSGGGGTGGRGGAGQKPAPGRHGAQPAASAPPRVGGQGPAARGMAAAKVAVGGGGGRGGSLPVKSEPHQASPLHPLLDDGDVMGLAAHTDDITATATWHSMSDLEPAHDLLVSPQSDQPRSPQGLWGEVGGGGGGLGGVGLGLDGDGGDGDDTLLQPGLDFGRDHEDKQGAIMPWDSPPRWLSPTRNTPHLPQNTRATASPPPIAAATATHTHTHTQQQQQQFPGQGQSQNQPLSPTYRHHHNNNNGPSRQGSNQQPPHTTHTPAQAQAQPHHPHPPRQHPPVWQPLPALPAVKHQQHPQQKEAAAAGRGVAPHSAARPSTFLPGAAAAPAPAPAALGRPAVVASPLAAPVNDLWSGLFKDELALFDAGIPDFSYRGEAGAAGGVGADMGSLAAQELGRMWANEDLDFDMQLSVF